MCRGVLEVLENSALGGPRLHSGEAAPPLGFRLRARRSETKLLRARRHPLVSGGLGSPHPVARSWLGAASLTPTWGGVSGVLDSAVARWAL